MAQSAPNIATPLEKVIPILFQAFNLCKTCFTHRRPVQPPAGTKLLEKTEFWGKLQRKTINFENGKLVQALPESNITQTSSQDVSSIHEEQL